MKGTAQTKGPAAAGSEEMLLSARGLSYTYHGGSHSVFSNMDIDAKKGCMLAVLGNNGAGKSTLLDLLTGILKPDEGAISVMSRDLASLSRRDVAQRIAYVPQRQTIPHLSVYDEILLGRKPHITWGISDYDREVVSHAIDSLGLASYAQRYCDELSGGERQKVFIARALAQEPGILVLDEPTSALDPKNQLEVLGAIRSITHRNGLASVLVLHDINLALRFCDGFLLVRDGVVVAQDDSSAVTSETLTATYGTDFKIVEIDGVKVAIPAAA